MTKWTSYYGRICEVEIKTDDAGRFAGFSYKGAGIMWSVPVVIIPDGFYETAEQCVAALRLKLLSEADRMETVSKWLTGQGAELAETAVVYRSRALNLESEVVQS